jgi:hypothetical protein
MCPIKTASKLNPPSKIYPPIKSTEEQPDKSCKSNFYLTFTTKYYHQFGFAPDF